MFSIKYVYIQRCIVCLICVWLVEDFILKLYKLLIIYFQIYKFFIYYIYKLYLIYKGKLVNNERKCYVYDLKCYES